MWRLSDKISWCAAHELQGVGFDPVLGFRCVLGVGRNLEGLDPRKTVLAVPETVPYFSVCWPDHERPPALYWNTLWRILNVILDSHLFPLLVHCRAGQQRSPAVAALVAARLYQKDEVKVELPLWLDKARLVRSDICFQQGATEPVEYVKGLLNFCGARWPT